MLNNLLFSQNKGLIYYGQIDSPKLKSASGPEFNAYMVFNKTESYYVYKKDSLELRKNFKTMYESNDGETVIAFPGRQTFPHGNQVYNNTRRDSIYWNQWAKFYVSEKTPKINWILENETKKIGAFIARKARGKYRGRMYTAWYTLEIPLPFGPWKLQGLPGLILEAHDEYNEIFIYFKSVKYPTNNKAAISHVKREKNHSKKWRSKEDFKNRLIDIYNRYNNNSYLMSEKYNQDSEVMPIKEFVIESF